MPGHGQFTSTTRRVVEDDSDSPGRNRLRLGSVPPNVKLVDTKPVYVVMHSDREYGSAMKPAVYDPYYGVNYVPSSGRDSWSAYHISDAALDDNDELVLKSRERDSHFIKDINRKLASVLHAAPPPPRPKATTRATKTAAAAPAPAVSFAAPPLKPPRAPATQQRQPARPKPSPLTGGDFLMSKLNEEAPDLRNPADVSALRAQLRDTSGLLDKQRLLLERYRTDPNEYRRPPLAGVVGATASAGGVPARRFDRATSLQPESSSRPKLSPVRSHIRDVLERSRQK